MKSIAIILASAGAAHALVTRGSGSACCFHLDAAGGPGGPVGQLDDGQNRIGQTGLPRGQYCLDNNGGLTDSHGRGCILTPPTTQWQCDAGAKPTLGFSISTAGALEYKSSDKFFACPTGDHGGFNIYSTTLPGEPGCVPITLKPDSCVPSTPPSGAPSSPLKGSAPLPSDSSSTPVSPGQSSAPQQPGQSSNPLPPAYSGTTQPGQSSAPQQPGQSSNPLPPAYSGTPQPPKGSCPLDLPTDFEFPHLIVPVDADQPNKAFGTSFNGTAKGAISSIFNFDLPVSMAGKQCALQFALPTTSQLETSSFEIAGQGVFSFNMLAAAATKSTTYGTMAGIQQSYGLYELAAGKVVTIARFECTAGKAVGIRMSAEQNSQINYFQDFNPCPIGLYITPA